MVTFKAQSKPKELKLKSKYTHSLPVLYSADRPKKLGDVQSRTLHLHHQLREKEEFLLPTYALPQRSN